MATPIRFQGLVKTTAEIEADKFAGRVGWSTTLARYIAYYNSTQYAQMARRDVLETFVAGLQDSTLGVGLPMFAGTSGRLSTESVANFRSRIAAVNKDGDTMTGGLTLSAGNLNVGAGAIQTAGVTRISSGGAGALTTLSTTGMVTAAQATISDIPAGSVVRATTGGRLAGDAGLVAGTYNGVTQDLTIGNGIAYDTAAQLSLNTADVQRTSVFFKSASVPNWAFTCRGNAEAVPRQLMLRAYLAGVEVDQPLTVEQASAGVITLGGATARPVNFTGAIQTAGVPRISSGGAGALTTLSTTGMATVAQATVSDLTTGRMVSTTTGGRLQALDAAGSRALIDAVASADLFDAALLTATIGNNASNVNYWTKLATITLGNGYYYAGGIVALSSMYSTHHALIASWNVAAATTTGISSCTVRVLSCSGIDPSKIVAIATKTWAVDGANEVELWLQVPSGNTLYGIRHLAAEYAAPNVTFTTYTSFAWVAAPSAGTQYAGGYNILANSARFIGQAGAGSRLVQAGADGTNSASIPVPTAFIQTLMDDADAATARATLGALAASEKGAANGVAPLGSDSKIAAAYLPAYVDDVLEFANLAAFPATGESGKIYVAIDTAKTYRWSGSAYVVISETLALGETSSTAYRGDRGATAYTHSQATGNPHGTTFEQIASKPTTLAGYGITNAQPLDSDLTAIAALSTQVFGRSLLTQIDAAAARATLGAAKGNRIVVRDYDAIVATTTDTTLDSVALDSFCGPGKSVKFSYAVSTNDPLKQPIITLKYAGVTVFAITLTGNTSSIVFDMAYFANDNIKFWGVVINDGTPTYINTFSSGPVSGAGTLTLACKTTSGTTTVAFSGSILEF